MHLACELLAKIHVYRRSAGALAGTELWPRVKPQLAAMRVREALFKVDPALAQPNT